MDLKQCNYNEICNLHGTGWSTGTGYGFSTVPKDKLSKFDQFDFNLQSSKARSFNYYLRKSNKEANIVIECPVSCLLASTNYIATANIMWILKLFEIPNLGRELDTLSENINQYILN